MSDDPFHHVRDFTFLELPGGNHLPLPSVFGFQLTKFMVLQLVAAAVVWFVFTGLARQVRSGQPARGRFWNFWEVIALYLRDHVVRPTIGDHSHDQHGSHDQHDHHNPGHKHAAEGGMAGSSLSQMGHPADRYLPFIWSCFFYILICNLLGAVPFLGSATGDLNVTGVLALTAMGATYIFGVQAMGTGGFFANLMPDTGISGPAGMLLGGMMFVIEFIGFFIKHGVLAVRLFANIMGGHTVVGVILGFIAQAARPGVSGVIYGLVLPGSIVGQIFIGLLELFVAFLQAYVFAFLAAIFIAGAVHKH